MLAIRRRRRGVSHAPIAATLAWAGAGDALEEGWDVGAGANACAVTHIISRKSIFAKKHRSARQRSHRDVMTGAENNTGGAKRQPDVSAMAVSCSRESG